MPGEEELGSLGLIITARCGRGLMVNGIPLASLEHHDERMNEN